MRSSIAVIRPGGTGPAKEAEQNQEGVGGRKQRGGTSFAPPAITLGIHETASSPATIRTAESLPVRQDRNIGFGWRSLIDRLIGRVATILCERKGDATRL